MPFVEQVLAPVFYVFDPTKRLFFIYLMSSLVLGFLVLWGQTKDPSKSIQALFNKKIWSHRSTFIDLKLFLLNSILKTILFSVVLISSVFFAKVVMRTLYSVFPNHELLKVSYSQAILVYSVVSFVALDFSRFLQHYLFHKVPLLWSFHKIHHSAEVLTPLSLYRTHPVESIVSSFRHTIVVGVVSGCFMFYTGAMIGVYAILGVNLFDFLFNLVGSNLRHSHVWLSFGPLNHILISPAQHQIHHSRALRHRDKNLGVALAIWDKLFSTFYQVHTKEFIVFGLRGETHKTLWQCLKAPMIKAKPVK